MAKPSGLVDLLVVPRSAFALFSCLYFNVMKEMVYSRSWAAIPLATICLVVLFFGCSKAELKQALDEAKAKTQTLTETTIQTIEEKLPERGHLTLDSTASIDEIGLVNLELISIGDGRPNVVQIATYNMGRPGQDFPAILFHGTAKAGTAGSLVGETIQCDVYLQARPDTPIAMTGPSSSLSITFDSLGEDGTTLHATLGKADLLTSEDQTITIRGGQMIAVIKEASP